MKILKKTNPIKVEEKPIVEEPKKALDEGASMTLTSDEIAQLKEVLPKIIALLDGEAEIEIIDEAEESNEEDVIEEDIEVEEPTEVVSVEEEESTDEVEEEAEEPKAEDDASTAAFNAEEILKDPAKKAALEKALGVQKATDEQPKPKKVFVKKTINKKAGDSLDVPAKKPNAELVETPVIETVKSENRVIRKFDFHKNQK